MSFYYLFEDYKKIVKNEARKPTFTQKMLLGITAVFIILFIVFLQIFIFHAIHATKFTKKEWWFLSISVFLFLCLVICILVTNKYLKFPNLNFRIESEKHITNVIELLTNAGVDIKNKIVLDSLINEAKEIQNKIPFFELDKVSSNFFSLIFFTVNIILLITSQNTKFSFYQISVIVLNFIYAVTMLKIFFWYLSFLIKNFKEHKYSLHNDFINDLKQIIIFHTFKETPKTV